MTSVRRWAPLAVLVVLATASLLVNKWGWAQYVRAVNSADGQLLAATGHGLSASDSMPWAALIAPLLSVTGAAAVAYLLRRAHRAPWFLGAALIPFLVSGGATTHGWLRPGVGLDAYASGAGVMRGSLDLRTYGAGPAWVLWAGTALTISIVVLPSWVAEPAATATSKKPAVLRVLPYAFAAGLAAFSALGLLDASQTGGDQLRIMALGAVGATVCVLAGAVLARDSALRHLALTAVALALIGVASLNPGAGLATKLIVASLATVAVAVAEVAVRRPRLRRRGAALAEAV